MADGNIYVSYRYGGAPEIDTSGGTPIGDMTAAGGLAAAFDDEDQVISTLCARKNTSTSAYIGVTLAAESKVDAVEMFPSLDGGFGAGNVSFNVRGSTTAQGAPANLAAAATHGTQIATLGPFVDTDIWRRLMVSVAKTTLFKHVFAVITTTSSGNINVAEMRVYKAINA